MLAATPPSLCHLSNGQSETPASASGGQDAPPSAAGGEIVPQTPTAQPENLLIPWLEYVGISGRNITVGPGGGFFEHSQLFVFFFNQIPRVKVLLTLVPLFALVLKNEAPPLPAPSLPDASASDSTDDPDASASAPQTYEDTTPAPTDELGEL